MGALLAIRNLFWLAACMTFLGLYLSISLMWIGLSLFLLSGLLLAAQTRNVSWLTQSSLFSPSVLLASVMTLSVILAAPYPYKGAIPKIVMPFFLFLFAWFFQLFPQSKKTLVRTSVFLSIFGAFLSTTQSFGIFQTYLPGLNRYIYPVPHNVDMYLAAGFTRLHTTFAFTLIFLFHILLSQSLFSRDVRRKPVFMAASAFCVVGILFTFSRGAWLALCVSAGLVFLITNFKTFFKVFFIFGVSFSLVFFAIPGFQQRVASFRIEANSERFELWKVCWKMFQDSPWFGQGYDSFGSKIALFSNLPTVSPGTPLDPHNMYLEFLATSGLIGLLCFLFFLGCIFKFLFQGLKFNPWFLSAFGILVSFCVGGFFDRYFNMPHTLIPVLLLVGLCHSEPVGKSEQSFLFQ